MAKYYYKDGDSEYCYPLEYHLEYMRENGIEKMDVFEAKMENDSEFFFCKEVMEVGEKNGTCGKMCEDYQPRNNKSGICKHYGYVYENTDVVKKLRLNKKQKNESVNNKLQV